MKKNLIILLNFAIVCNLYHTIGSIHRKVKHTGLISQILKNMTKLCNTCCNNSLEPVEKDWILYDVLRVLGTARK